jgi:hypothetical protein
LRRSVVAGSPRASQPARLDVRVFAPNLGVGERAEQANTALPASGSTELQTARTGAVAVSLPDGQVLIAGHIQQRSITLT